ncbi:putative tyrosine decarboxylase [Cladophialophora carrionii]|uniref:Putative tyrosine decarboxylase n=1 Tax=Cladophialophora carrionii TaxID=86049 RepID=A0A1C1CYJ9_9EURO|nr:putative tyrosine decarboxylase [Cladophialophora carrionii]
MYPTKSQYSTRAMDQQTGLDDVIRALQQIISSPDLAISHQLSTSTPNGREENFPVLPRDVQKPPSPNITEPLASSTAGTELFDQQHQRQDTLLSRLGVHLTTAVLPYLNLSSLSPNYYGFVTGGATPAALLGDFLASMYDQNVQVHLPKETLATTLEVVALNMLVQLFRLPESTWAVGKPDTTGGGTFTTGATASNVLGLALGREHVLRHKLRSLVGHDAQSPDTDSDTSTGEQGLFHLMQKAGVTRIQVLSTLPHSSIAKAASIVGIGRRNVISISAKDDPLEIDLQKLEQEALKPDVLNIFAISAGEVNTGRFATDSASQWTQIRHICDTHGVWVHVDGAFGLFGRLIPEADAEADAEDEAGEGAEPPDAEYSSIVRGVQGLELADSITGDCHKLLNVPYDCGVFFTRHKSLMEDVFQNGNAAYLTGGVAGSSARGRGRDDSDNNNDDTFLATIQSPLNIGIENSRRFRALPVYATLTAYGREGYVAMLKRQIGLARRVTRWLLGDPRFEVLPRSRKAAGGSAADDTVARTFIVVLFRVRRGSKDDNDDDDDDADADDATTRSFVRRVNQTGKMYMTGTVWEGRAAARIAVSNWQVDVERDGALIEGVLNEGVLNEVVV